MPVSFAALLKNKNRKDRETVLKFRAHAHFWDQNMSIAPNLFRRHIDSFARKKTPKVKKSFFFDCLKNTLYGFN